MKELKFFLSLIEKLLENNTTDGLLDYKGFADDVINWYFKERGI